MGKLFTALARPSTSPCRWRRSSSSSSGGKGGRNTSSIARNPEESVSMTASSSRGPAKSAGELDLLGCPFTSEQLKKLRDAFDFFDIDNDGRISFGELRKVLKFLGTRVSEDEAKRIIADVDINCNGTVEFNEFVVMMAAYHRKSHEANGQEPATAEEAEILEAFQAFDHNGDNYIDFTELKKTMQFLGEGVTDADVECMIREADVDHDGRIDFEEFKKLLATVKRRM